MTSLLIGEEVSEIRRDNSVKQSYSFREMIH